MADLLTSLVVPSSPRSSQESFRSLSSQPCRTPPPPSSPKRLSSAPTPSTDQTSVSQAASLPVYDIDSYLAQNADLRSAPLIKNSSSNTYTAGSANCIEPVSLGKKTGFYVSALNTQCQVKGFLPVFKIEGTTDFGGVLKLRDTTVAADQRWCSKKEAKEALAERGLEILKRIEAIAKVAGEAHEPGKNWVGLLHEYHNQSNPNLGPIYQDYALGSAFASTCTIPSQPNRSFGSLMDAFPSKKGARANAAKEAVEYLVDKGEVNADGTSKGRKKVKIGAAVRVQGEGLKVQRDTSFAQKVTAICPLLGLTCPQYHLEPASALAPNMLNGHATFPFAPELPGSIGEVRNVYGKKKAKEEVARAVWEVLEAMAAERNVRVDLEEGNEDMD